MPNLPAKRAVIAIERWSNGTKKRRKSCLKVINVNCVNLTNLKKMVKKSRQNHF